MAHASISGTALRGSLLNAKSRDFALGVLRSFSHPEDRLDGKIGAGKSGRLGAMAAARIFGKLHGRSQVRLKRAAIGGVFDPRQRVIVKLHYHAHAGGGGGKLLAHGRYLERDGAGEKGEPGQFYNRERDAEDVRARLVVWDQSDRRHMRIILAPESGVRFVDLKDATRAIMSRMERDLGIPLEWVAVNHFNTDNPHMHVILRGRRRDGPDLVIPREYASHGLRYAARDVATEMLGDRGREDERLALSRDVRALRLTRLDDLLQTHADLSRPVRLQTLGRQLNPAVAAALRERLRELAKMGLATNYGRDRFEVTPEWRDKLQRAGDQIDIKRILSRPLEPDLPKTRLFSPEMGTLAGEVLHFGARGETGAKAFVIFKPDGGGPILVNTSTSAIREVQKGDIAVIRPGARSSSRASLSFTRLPDLKHQTTLLAFTPLDRDLLRVLKGEKPHLPQVQAVARALQARENWLEQEGLAKRAVNGRLMLSDRLSTDLYELELRRVQNALANETGKPILRIQEGLDREWRVKGVGSLSFGRYAMLERADGIAIIRISGRTELEIGKAYTIKVSAKGLKITRSIELER